VTSTGEKKQQYVKTEKSVFIIRFSQLPTHLLESSNSVFFQILKMTKGTPIIFTLAFFSPRNYFETVKTIFCSKNSSKVAESSKSLLNNEEHTKKFFPFFFDISPTTSSSSKNLIGQKL